MGRGTLLSCLGPACCLLLLLGDYGGLGSRGKQRGPLEERQSAVTEAAPWGRTRYEAVKKQLGAVGALSKQYWQYLACNVWQEGCGKDEEEKTSPGPGWSLPLVGQDYLEILSAWYCSFGKCCKTGDCRIINNVTGLELDLHEQLHGQHLAKEIVIRAVRGFLQSPQPQKALVLSFHGWSGTGKNFVARMVAAHLYRDGLKSECVRVFIALFHFPHHKYVDSYKVQLEKQISETVQLCKQSLFIFDEAEKLHFGLVDVIKPFMARSDKGQQDNRRSIFLFLSCPDPPTWHATQLQRPCQRPYVTKQREQGVLNCSGVQSVLGGLHHAWWQCDTDLLSQGCLWSRPCLDVAWICSCDWAWVVGAHGYRSARGSRMGMSCADKVAKGGGDGFFILPPLHLWSRSGVSDT
uniref:Torsin family 3 member A n=1 Tax=Pavo cristatus TaxID=9049 RepID=A0A8C9G4H6_PAVCR